MARQQRKQKPQGRRGMISRRTFLQGVVAASAAAGVVGMPTTGTALPADTALKVLTPDQSGMLTAVLNRLIPPSGAMPGAGELGIASFIDKVLVEAPHLRRHVVGLLAALPERSAFARLPEAEADDLLQQLEQEQNESFDILLQATYTGYYGHPQVLSTIGWVDPDDSSHALAHFDPSLLDEVRKRGPMYRDV